MKNSSPPFPPPLPQGNSPKRNFVFNWHFFLQIFREKNSKIFFYILESSETGCGILWNFPVGNIPWGVIFQGGLIRNPSVEWRYVNRESKFEFWLILWLFEIGYFLLSFIHIWLIFLFIFFSRPFSSPDFWVLWNASIFRKFSNIPLVRNLVKFSHHEIFGLSKKLVMIENPGISIAWMFLKTIQDC